VEGVALFQHEDSDGGRRLRSRIVLDSNLSFQFSVYVKGVPTKKSATSAAASTIGSLVLLSCFTFFGLVVDMVVV
jgi:hypothetical protein